MKAGQNLSTPGERLRRARVLAGLTTRRQFEEKHNISANTLQGWEQGKNPLSLKGARRIVQALKGEGLICSVEWLVHGEGMPPRSFEVLQAGLEEPFLENESLTQLNLREEETIYQETQTFKQKNPNAIVLTVSDDTMMPYFFIGDYIAGIRTNSNIDQYIGSACIVELEQNVIVPRFLQKGTRTDRYTLSATNPKTTASEPLNFYNVHVVHVAPIIWHRRKISSLMKG